MSIERVSVIAPMWSEARHIEHFVTDLAARDFDGHIELLVADGRLDRRVGRAAPRCRRAARRRRHPLDAAQTAQPRRERAKVVRGAFAVSIAALVASALWSRRARRVLRAEAAIYAAGALGFGLLALRRCGEDWSLLPCVAAAFPTMHPAYGLGSVAGIGRAAAR